jgi:disulfide bond formation protein DsbB
MKMTFLHSMTPRQLAAISTALSAATLMGAFLFEHVGGLAPCALCITQRWAHVAVIAAGLAMLAKPSRLAGIVLLLSSLNAFVQAMRHVGVEKKWWGSECATGNGFSELSAEELLEAIMNAPIVRCDEIAWQMAGISMAGWNAVICLGIAVLAGLSIRRTKPILKEKGET